MTPQERDLLTRFLDELARAQPGPTDPEAAGQIERALSSHPDAAYVLVQHAILADAALHDAQAQAADLRQRLDAMAGGPPLQEGGQAPSFLGALFGRARPNLEPTPSGGSSGGWSPPSAVPANAQPYTYAAPYPQPGAGPFSGGGGLGSFLRSAGTTAAGVAGGAFLFEGLSDLFGGGERRHEMFDDGGGRSGFADMDAGRGGDGQFDVRDDVGGGGDSGGDYS